MANWAKGTFVVVEGLQSESRRSLNGTLGVTVGKAKTHGGNTRYPVFMFAQDDDEAGEKVPILEDAQAMTIKIENLAEVEHLDDAVRTLFRESALAKVVKATAPDQVTGMQVFLAEKCIEVTEEMEGRVDIEASMLLARCLLLRKQSAKETDRRLLKSDCQRVLQILEPAVPLLLSGESTLRYQNYQLAAQMVNMLLGAAPFAGEDSRQPIHVHQQCLDCALQCGQGLSTKDNDYDERRNHSVKVLQSFASRVGSIAGRGGPQGDDQLGSIAVRGFEAALQIDPENVVNIASMATTCNEISNDYVKSSRLYRKALSLPYEVADQLEIGADAAHANWKEQLVLCQLKLPGMPLEGVSYMAPSGQPQRYECSRISSGPGGSTMIASTEPPFMYTVPTTDPDDTAVFPPHILEMVQPHLLDGDE